MTSAPPPPDPCIAANTCAPGVWVDVTPPSINLTSGDCGNYGTESVWVDPTATQNVYTLFMCQGMWKSSDFGRTWTGPINTGNNGATVGDCAGGFTIPQRSSVAPAIMYLSCLRGSGLGFWVSTDSGVDWTLHNVAPGGSRQDFYPPSVDPYDDQHLIMAGHEMNVLVQSTDGGQTWTAINADSGMTQNGGTAFIQFVDTGNPATTRNTWLWMAQVTGGTIGTWRTSDGGTSWTRVDSNEHLHGVEQFYQPDTSGVIYMAGAYSALGWGILRSTDYGMTWAHVGQTQTETTVFGTNYFVYGGQGGPAGAGVMVAPSLEIAGQPGTGTWSASTAPTSMTQGPGWAAVTNNGMFNVIITANFNAGLWRYVEPPPAASADE